VAAEISAGLQPPPSGLDHSSGPFYFVPSKNRGVPHISLVFREMWDATALHVRLSEGRKRLRFVVSHISRKMSEIWGTPRFWEGTKYGPRNSVAELNLETV
jgi:hypothetical protein